MTIGWILDKMMPETAVEIISFKEHRMSVLNSKAGALLSRADLQSREVDDWGFKPIGSSGMSKLRIVISE